VAHRKDGSDLDTPIMQLPTFQRLQWFTKGWLTTVTQEMYAEAYERDPILNLHDFGQPGEIAGHRVWLYRWFSLTYRNGEQVPVSSGVDVA
jgi:hypothetical protein